MKKLSTRHWSLADISWDRFRPDDTDPRMLWVIRATSLVESRADLYTGYLQDLFRERPEAASQIRQWGAEEAQHGAALKRWVELADKGFSFEEKDSAYRSEVEYYDHTGSSVRGSLQNELLCRCVIESLASAYYRAIKDASTEPVLREICDRLSRDEARHYTMFHSLLCEERARGANGLWANLWVVYRRIRDLENDQIAFAFHCCDAEGSTAYSARGAAVVFLPTLYKLYQVEHVVYAARLILHALGLKLPGSAIKTLGVFGVASMRVRAGLMNLEAAARSRYPLAFPAGPVPAH